MNERMGKERRRGARSTARSAAVATIVIAASVAGLVGSPAGAGEEDWSVARIWNEQLLNAISMDFARPPVHARNLYHLAAAMWDAWAVYDESAIGVFSKEKQTAEDVEAARHEAISYAAYRLIEHRYANSPGAKQTMAAIEAQMNALGFDPTVTTAIGDSPAAVGNRCAYTIITQGFGDGSNEGINFADPFYEPINEPLIVEEPGAPTLVDPNRWQSIWLNVVIDQAGNILDGNVPTFVGPHWGWVTPFALSEEHLSEPGLYLDPGPPPMLGTETHQDWIDTFANVAVTSSVLDPDLPETIDISPAVFGNNPLGTNDGTGHGPINPVTGEPYEPNVVKLGDYGRIVAEFWADGPNSATPPGHWHEIANHLVVDSPYFEPRLGGTGPLLDQLEWDVKMYLAIGGAGHDSAVACWGVKGYYDWVRPISAIRYMADRGQSSDPKLPSYHPEGLPLIDGVTELITEESIQPGGAHAHLAEMVVDEFGFPIFDGQGNLQWDATPFIGEVAVMAWPGPPDGPVALPPVWVHPDVIDLDAPYSGVRWVRAKRWTTYQLGTFITPPFAGYVSGHTTFSRAAAEVLAALTGSIYFPGGLGEYHFPQGEFLEFEYGPSEDVTLQWASFFDASDQSARSRIFGGIHPYADDFPARFMGHEIGQIVAAKAFEHFNDGGVRPCPPDLNGDSEVNILDLLQVLGDWGLCPKGGSCPTDLNGDNVVNVLDLLQVLAAWGACPE